MRLGNNLPKTARDAKALGLTRYFSGKPCKFGHISERRASNASCIECLRAREKEWRTVNKDKKNAINKRWHAKNTDSLLEYKGEWYLANAERLRAKAKINGKAWRNAYPDRNAAKERNRRSRIRSAPGTHTAEDIAVIRLSQNDCCVYCSAKLDGGGDVDHIVALARGGTNWPSNLQLLCSFCNRSKGARLHEEFICRRV